MLIGAQKLAPPPPPAPGATPAQKLTTPASYYEPVGPFFFYVETLTANTTPNKYGFAPTVACIQSGVFKRGMKIVVRFEVLDTKTGKRVTDKDGATIKLVLPHGEEVPGRWTIRGSVAALPDSAWMWDTSWDIPPDYPVGSLDYRIVVTTKDGRTGTFTPPIQKTRNGGYSCADHRLTGLASKAIHVFYAKAADKRISNCARSTARTASRLGLQRAARDCCFCGYRPCHLTYSRSSQ